MKYEDLEAALNSLDFLSKRGSSERGAFKATCSFYIIGTYYKVYVYKGKDGSGNVSFVCMKDIHHNVTLEDMFEGLPEDIRERIIFNLDLFRQNKRSYPPEILIGKPILMSNIMQDLVDEP